MGFGVKEPRTANGEHVPGTSTILDIVVSDESGEQHDNIPPSMKRITKKNGDVIILVPQPSDSPNDPLNWPQWKKNMTYLSICLSVSMAGALGPILSPVTATIAQDFRVPINKAAQPAGWPLLTAGIGAYLSQAWAPVMGKRSTYIMATTILFATTIWNGYIHTFNELVACRAVSGLGNGAYDSIVISSIGDLFFVHERGKRIVFYNIVTLGVANVTPILGGYISQVYGWPMMFRILFAFTGVALIAIIFACPEHAYVRPTVFETDVNSATDLTSPVQEKSEGTVRSSPVERDSGENNKEKGQDGETSAEASGAVSQEKPRTYLEELKPFNGFITRQNPLVLLARPFACFLYPAVFWGFTVGGLWSAWTIGLAVVVAQIFGGPPNLFDETQLGLLFIFPSVFLILGCILGFMLSDWWPKYCSRRNGGVFEPEFRLILLIPVLLVGIPGLFGFGYYAAGRNDKWVAASCLQGLIAFASVFGASVSFNYVLDSHRNRSVEVTVSMVMLRNFFWFGSSYFLPDWLLIASTKTIFSVIGGIQLGITLFSILVYMYGKRLRWWFHRHDPLTLLGLA